ncbi:DUF1501 domain-containing protein [Telmatocola sphagniphila]|uniref:DUF1501 domain-containing protein n=1 Tax=Telmatocola sphagniphila TaxID=1123043 RepID=A0A8E6B1U5_9BACT|nr:DUF1501 domain-containing protein [Telmatocola sphagniphila]QVL30106.1 DUF1501 domain-containing protein [Telmatocola sphagniphila]
MFGTQNRRHFMSHMAGMSAMSLPGLAFLNSIHAQSKELKKKQKSLIILWMGGGPSTIDLWDMKPGHANGGEHKPISTSVGGIQISEHLPTVAKQMKNMAIIRSLTTTEGDHMRGTTLMNTGRSPNPLVDFPSIGSVLSYLNRENETDLPSFISAGGGSRGPGFLGMRYAPFNVQNPGLPPENIKTPSDVTADRMKTRESMFNKLEAGFQHSTHLDKDASKSHQEVYGKAMNLVVSSKKDLFALNNQSDITRYGNNNFGKGCLLAKKLTEAGAVAVEVSLGGWDMHAGIFNALATRALPTLDKAMGSLIEDLEKSGRLKDTVVVWMGDFGRTPRINQNGGRDHYPRAWSVVVAGGNIKGGQVVGSTDAGGEMVKDNPVKINNLYATIYAALGLDPKAQIRDNLGRPTYLAADKEADVLPIKELVG